MSDTRSTRICCALVLACGMWAPGGCAFYRPELSEAALTDRYSAEQSRAQAEFAESVRALVRRLHREHEDFASGRSADPPVLDFLALSGGGDKGAFGAGFLCGWDEVRDPQMLRPDFDVVTGVSTGALIAPFAFLGARCELERVEHFYRNPDPGWIQLRDILFFLPGRVSLLETAGLERELRRTFDADLVCRLADEAAKGKILGISATNLEFGAQRRWDLGREARRACQTGDVDRVHRILLASSSIPGAFPPVELDGFLYSDGGITANILIPLEAHTDSALLHVWRREYPGVPVPRIRYWVIVNNQLRQPPKTAQATWPSTASIGIAAAIRSSNLTHIELLAARADYLNATQGLHIEVRAAAIPDDWRPPVEGSFRAETMNSLADAGRRMGADPSSWTLYTSEKR